MKIVRPYFSPRHALLVGSCALAIGLPHAAARAQDVPTEPGTGGASPGPQAGTETPANPADAAAVNSTNDQEIVVTAQKRVQRALDVPISITAVDTQALATRGQSRLQDYFRQVPALSLNQQAGGFTNLVIRGLSTGIANNPTVGVTIDDIPFGSSTALGFGDLLIPDIDSSDLARVEVLRGPQGTLYGASSMGGLIKFVTADPSFSSVSGRVQGDLNTVHRGGVGGGLRGAINVPVNQQFAIRASGFYRRDPGYIDDPVHDEKNVNEVDVWGGRISALWRPTDAISLKLGALLQKTDADGSPDIDADYRLDPLFGSLEQIRTPGTGEYRFKVQLYSSVLNIDLGPATLTSVTGYGINDYSAKTEFPPYNFLAPLFFGPDSNVALLGSDFRTRKFTQEVRVASDGAKRFEWLVGAFYTREKTDARQIIEGGNSSTGAVQGLILDSAFPTKFRELAGFATATVHLTPKFDVQVGGRYSENRQSYFEYDIGPIIGPVPFEYRQKTKGKAFTYLLTPRYKFSDNLMAYGRVASGYRAGGPNPTAEFFGLPTSYKPDKTYNYEVGLKGQTADRRLSFDLALFHIDWKDVQLQARDPATAFPYFLNGGKARSQGFEASGNWRNGQGLTVTGGLSYADAEVRKALPPGLSGGKGDALPFSPKFSANLGADQDFAIGSGYTASVGGTLVYSSKRYGLFTRTAAEFRPELPGYATIDLRTGLRRDAWSLTAYVTNLTDKRGLVSAGTRSSLALPSSPFFITVVRPRTIGMSAQYHF